MRLWVATIAFGVGMAGSAQASSFVTIAPPGKGDTPSIVVMGDWKPMTSVVQPSVVAASPSVAMAEMAQHSDMDAIQLAYPLPQTPEAVDFRIVAISASIIAFDPPAPSVTLEQVAAIEPALKPPVDPPNTPAHFGAPIVIRGGIVGGIVGGASGGPVAVAMPAPAAKITGKGKAPRVETKTNAEGKKVIVINESPAPKQKPAAPAQPTAAPPARQYAQPQ